MKLARGLWLAVTLTILASPVALVVINSFNSSPFSQFPPAGFSLDWYVRVLNYAPFLTAFVYSVALGIGASAVATVAGVMASIALTRYGFRGRSALATFFSAPLIAPRAAIGLSGYVLFVVAAAHIGGISVTADPLPLVLVHALFGLPLVVVIVSASLVRYDRALDEAARDLGANNLAVFRRITFPLLRGSIVIAAALAFVTSFDETEASLFFASVSGTTLPIAMFNFLEQDQTPTIAALSTLMLAATALSLGIALVFGSTRSAARTVALPVVTPPKGP